MRPRWRKVLADLWGNLARFILVTLSLTVGLFSVGMITGGYVTTLQDMSGGYQAINPADLRINTENFSESLLERVKRLDGVTNADGERLFFAQVRSGEGEWKNMILQAIPEDDQKVDQIELLEGEMPDEREILLDVHRDVGLLTGDPAILQLPSGAIKELPISGMVRDQTIGVSATSYFVAPIHGYVPFDSLPWLEQPQSYSTILVSLDPALSSEKVAALRDEITGLVEESGRAGRQRGGRPDSRHQPRHQSHIVFLTFRKKSHKEMRVLWQRPSESTWGPQTRVSPSWRATSPK